MGVRTVAERGGGDLLSDAPLPPLLFQRLIALIAVVFSFVVVFGDEATLLERLAIFGGEEALIEDLLGDVDAGGGLDALLAVEAEEGLFEVVKPVEDDAAADQEVDDALAIGLQRRGVVGQ